MSKSSGTAATDRENLGQRNRGCVQGRDDRLSELCAQWKAADAAAESARWAAATFWTGLGALITTVLGTGILLWQIILARRAVEDAGEATEAMQEANRLAQITQRAQIRPYVHFIDAPAEENTSFQRSEDLKLFVKNCGQTPARDVRIRIGRRMCKRPIGSTQPQFDLGDDEFPVIPPGERRWVTAPLSVFPASEIAKVASGEWVFLLRFRVDYTLPDGSSDFEDITSVIDADGLQSGGLLASKTQRERLD